MPPRIHKNSMLLLRDAGTAITAEVTSSTGWTNFSGKIVGEGSVDESRAVATRQVGGNAREEAYGGAITGTFTFTIERDDGGASDIYALLQPVWDSNGEFQFVSQPDVLSLTSGGVITPLASSSNPQEVGTAIMTAWNPVSFAGDATLPATITVTATTKADYRRFT